MVAGMLVKRAADTAESAASQFILAQSSAAWQSITLWAIKLIRSNQVVFRRLLDEVVPAKDVPVSQSKSGLAILSCRY